MNSLPPLHAACIDPAIEELGIARNRIADEFIRLTEKMRDFTELKDLKLAASAALAAHEIAVASKQIHDLATCLHRGIAARMNLEARV